MKAVEGMGKIHVHYSIGKLNKAFEEVGIVLPDYEIPDFRESIKHVAGDIVIVPPALLDSNVIKKFRMPQQQFVPDGCRFAVQDDGEVPMQVFR
jgi:hypothetical protein